MYCPEGKKRCGAVLTKEEMEFVIKHAVKEAKEKAENEAGIISGHNYGEYI